MDNILEIKNLKKIYHTKQGETLAVKDFSFDIKPGEFVAIVGPSGCGKSTILSILCGLEKESGGKIIMDDTMKNIKSNYTNIPLEEIITEIYKGGKVEK